MTDALDLIAEARRRQEASERDRDYWMDYAKAQRERCRRIIDMAKRRPIPPPDVDQDGDANWDQLRVLVDEFARVIADPYARYDDDDDGSMTHDRAKEMMVFRLARMIEAAVAAKGGQ